MSEKSDASFQAWEAEMLLFDGSPDVETPLFKQYVMAEKEALAVDVGFMALQAKKLGMFTMRQLHRLPVSEGEYILEVYSSPWGKRGDRSNQPEFLHITENIKPRYPEFPMTIRVKDYALGLQDCSVGLRKDAYEFAAANGFPLSPVPIIWERGDGDMGRFVCRGYSMPRPETSAGDDLLAYYRKQRRVAADLEKLLCLLNRDVSLEHEMP